MAFTRLNIDALKRQATKPTAVESTPNPNAHLDARSKAEAIAEAVAAKQHAERRQSTDTQDDNTAKEFGGPKGLEPTRYGDWEKAGRCFDF